MSHLERKLPSRRKEYCLSLYKILSRNPKFKIDENRKKKGQREELLYTPFDKTSVRTSSRLTSRSPTFIKAQSENLSYTVVLYFDIGRTCITLSHAWVRIVSWSVQYPLITITGNKNTTIKGIHLYRYLFQ